MDMKTTDKAALYKMIVVLGGLAILGWGCLIILAPFIPAILWAIILCLTTWPAFVWLQDRLNHLNVVSATLMTLLLFICFLVPLLFLGSSLADNFGTVYDSVIIALESKPDTPPVWLAEMPLIGEYASNAWLHYLGNADNLSAVLQEYAEPATQFLLAMGKTVGLGILDLSLGIVIAFFLFWHGDQVGERLNNLINRFIGERGQHLLEVSKKTMIGVVYGIMGAALAQGTAAGIGFWIAGIAGAPFLGLLTIFMSFLPFGTAMVWIPIAFWLFSQDMVGMGIFMVLWGIMVSSLDNIIRPYFISMGSSMPLLLVLLGVFGGILGFGFIGLFIGPTLLALAYTLVLDWSKHIQHNVKFKDES